MYVIASHDEAAEKKKEKRKKLKKSVRNLKKGDFS